MSKLRLIVSIITSFVIINLILLFNEMLNNYLIVYNLYSINTNNAVMIFTYFNISILLFLLFFTSKATYQELSCINL